MNLNYEIPYSHYILCGISSIAILILLILVTIFCFQKKPLRRIIAIFMMIIVLLFPAVTYYTEITQMKIYPIFVKKVVIVPSKVMLSSKHPQLAQQIINAIETNGQCENDLCTLKITEFKHSRNEMLITLPRNENAEIYCPSCATPINFDFKHMEFIAYIFIR